MVYHENFGDSRNEVKARYKAVTKRTESSESGISCVQANRNK